MIDTTNFHEGLIFEDHGEIFELLKYQHHRMSQSKAVIRAKVRNLKTGSVFDKSYASGEKFREVPVERRKKQYLYAEGEICHFMDQETFEQFTFDKKKMGESFKFLSENMEVDGIFVDEKLAMIELPKNVVLKVASTVPGVKGDSVSNMMKPATLESGIQVQVPLFIKEGDSIKVDTESGDYVERA